MSDGIGKKRYITVDQASKISGYTEVYVDRLCRLQKVQCRVMGDKKIIELDSLLKETGTLLLHDEHVGFLEVDDDSRYPLVEGAVSIPEELDTKEEGTHVGSIAVVGETVYAEDPNQYQTPGGSATNPTRIAGKNNAGRDATYFANVGKGVHPHSGNQKIHVPIQRSSEKLPSQSIYKEKLAQIAQEPQSAPLVPEVSVVNFSAKLETSPIIPPSPVPTLEGYTSQLPTILPERSLLANGALTVIALGFLVLPTFLGIGVMLQSGLSGGASWFSTQVHTGAAAVGLAEPNYISSSLFPHLEEVSVLLSAAGAVGGGTQTGSPGQTGIAITQSSGSGEGDAQIIKTIQDSFSDNVQVVQNPDGKTGYIRPIFRKGTGVQYLYMLVPIKN